MNRLIQRLRAATVADGIVVLAAFTLIAALRYPTWTAQALRERVATAIADVDTLSAVARRSRVSQRRWPAAAAPGEAPAELAELAGPEGPFSRLDYALAWTTWEVVDSVPAPPQVAPPSAPGDAPRPPDRPRMIPITRVVGGVAVHTGEEALRAELLSHYGAEASFVLDTIWMLVLPERAEPAAGRM